MEIKPLKIVWLLDSVWYFLIWFDLVHSFDSGLGSLPTAADSFFDSSGWRAPSRPVIPGSSRSCNSSGISKAKPMLHSSRLPTSGYKVRLQSMRCSQFGQHNSNRFWARSITVIINLWWNTLLITPFSSWRVLRTMAHFSQRVWSSICFTDACSLWSFGCQASRRARFSVPYYPQAAKVELFVYRRECTGKAMKQIAYSRTLFRLAKLPAHALHGQRSDMAGCR